METQQIKAHELRAGDAVHQTTNSDGGIIARVDVCDCGCDQVWVLYVDDVGAAPDSEAFEYDELVIITRTNGKEDRTNKEDRTQESGYPTGA